MRNRYIKAIAPGTSNINQSDGTLLQAVSIPSGDTVNTNIADSVISNSDNSYSVNVKATDPLSLPDEDYDIYVNGVLDQSVSLPALGNNTINITV